MSAVGILGAWLPAILWAGVIFFLSGDSMSSQHTRSFLEPMLRWLVPSITPETIEVIHDLVRKLAHVSEYFVFYLLLERGFRRGSMVAPESITIRALALAVAYSLADEVHQRFVPSRTPSLLDCCFDVVGAVLAAGFLGWMRGIR